MQQTNLLPEGMAYSYPPYSTDINQYYFAATEPGTDEGTEQPTVDTPEDTVTDEEKIEEAEKEVEQTQIQLFMTKMKSVGVISVLIALAVGTFTGFAGGALWYKNKVKKEQLIKTKNETELEKEIKDDLKSVDDYTDEFDLKK